MKQSAAMAVLVGVVICALATGRKNRPSFVQTTSDGRSENNDETHRKDSPGNPVEDSRGIVGLILVGTLRVLLPLIVYLSCLIGALLAAIYVLNSLSVEPTLKSVFDTAQQRTTSAGADLAPFESLPGPLTTDEQLALDTAELTLASVQFSYLTFEFAAGGLVAAIAVGVWAVAAPAISSLLDTIAPFAPPAHRHPRQ